MRRVPFDEDVPRPLRRDLVGFEIQTTVEMGWSGIVNGELLRRANESFDVFLTADRNLQFQQHVSKLRLGVVVLAAGSTKLEDLRSIAGDICVALDAVQPGQLLRVPADD